MNRNTFLSIFGVLAVLILLTTGVFLYAQGYRLDLRQRTLTTTGIILAKSLPEGAQVFLDGELIAATDSPISGISPGTHHLKLNKDGFMPWEKDIEVEAQRVTEVIAILPPLSPSLTAITQEGARLVTLAPSGTKAAFLSGKTLFLIPLTNQFLGFLRTTTQEVGNEPANFSFSIAAELLFSPNEDQILVSAEGKSILFNIGQASSQTVADPAALKSAWKEEAAARRTETAKQIKVPEQLKAPALLSSTYWSPDEYKFLYTQSSPSGREEFWVANFTSPLPPGEQQNRKIWETDPTTSSGQDLKLFWLADSQHFVMLENETVSLLDLDGSNKRDLFKGALTELVALSTSDLSRVIILTSLSPNGPANLYAISLR